MSTGKTCRPLGLNISHVLSYWELKKPLCPDSARPPRPCGMRCDLKGVTPAGAKSWPRVGLWPRLLQEYFDLMLTLGMADY